MVFSDVGEERFFAFLSTLRPAFVSFPGGIKCRRKRERGGMEARKAALATSLGKSRHFFRKGEERRGGWGEAMCFWV